MKFIRQDQSTISFEDQLSIIKKDNSPIKEIIERKDLSGFYYVDEKTISFKDITQVQVNVIDVGIMIFTFETNVFDKDKFINEVSKLKDIQINSFYDVLSKMKTLYATSEPFNPLFAIYVPKGKYCIFDDCFKTIVGNIKTLYISEEKGASTLEGKKDASVPNEVEEEQNKNKEKEKFNFKKLLEIISKEKIHFLFSFVATLLLSVTVGIGIYNAYLGKMLCIFFFICSLAGAFLNYMIYRDTFKQNSIKSSFYLLTVIFSTIGLLLGFGIYMIFKSLSKDTPEIQPHILLIISMMILVYLISMSLPLLVKYMVNCNLKCNTRR